ncbi:MAG: hypothetical protein CL489_17720 [Acidobacteria bacterium]|nr:hypothetical protein [Acidobacteriota bacterium]
MTNARHQKLLKRRTLRNIKRVRQHAAKRKIKKIEAKKEKAKSILTSPGSCAEVENAYDMQVETGISVA